MGEFPTNCIYSNRNGSRISPKSGEDLSALKRDDCKLVAIYNTRSKKKKIVKLAKLRKSSKSPVGSWSEYDDSDNEGCRALSNKITKTLWEGAYCRPHMPLNPSKSYSKAREQLLVEYVTYCIVEKKMNVILLQESFDDLNIALSEKFKDFHWEFKPDLTIGIIRSIVMENETVDTHDFQNKGMYRLMRHSGTSTYKNENGSFIEDTDNEVYHRILLNGFKNKQDTYVFIVNVHLKGGHDENDEHEKAEAIYRVMNKCCEWAKYYEYKKYVILIGGDFNHKVKELSDVVFWFVNEERRLPLKFVQYVIAQKPIDGFLLYTFEQNCTMSRSLSENYYEKSFKKLIKDEKQLGYKVKKLRDIIKNNTYPKNCSEILKLSHPYNDIEKYGITEKTSEKNMMTQMSDHYPVGVTIEFHSSTADDWHY